MGEVRNTNTEPAAKMLDLLVEGVLPKEFEGKVFSELTAAEQYTVTQAYDDLVIDKIETGEVIKVTEPETGEVTEEITAIGEKVMEEGGRQAASISIADEDPNE